MISDKKFRKYLLEKDNKELKEVVKNKSYYSPADIKAVEMEIRKRKKIKKMR